MIEKTIMRVDILSIISKHAILASPTDDRISPSSNMEILFSNPLEPNEVRIQASCDLCEIYLIMVCFRVLLDRFHHETNQSPWGFCWLLPFEIVAIDWVV